MPFQLTTRFLRKTKSQGSPIKKPKTLDGSRTSSRSLDIKKENFEGMGFEMGGYFFMTEHACNHSPVTPPRTARISGLKY